jgi:hypothetical protein
VKCLENPSLQETIKAAKAGNVISLPEGVVWLGNKKTFSNELFVRACYSELLEAKERYVELSDGLEGVVYTGTPGIGKSHLCAFVVARELIAGKVVFFEAVSSSIEQTRRVQFYRLDLARGAYSLASLQGLQFLGPDGNAVYIVDGGPASSTSPYAETQIFASPSRELYRYEAKAEGFLYLITPLFSLEEMEDCRSTITRFRNKVTSEDVEKWFSKAGGVARTVLKLSSEGLTLEAWVEKVRPKIVNMKYNKLETMLAGLQLNTFSAGSDDLFHWYVAVDNVPSDNNDTSPVKTALRHFKRKSLRFASGWVAQEFYLKWRLQKIFNVVSLILNHRGDVEISALRGYWFETISHMILTDGGKFECRMIDSGERFHLTLPRAADICLFKTPADASSKVKDDLSVYCMPTRSNQAAIDSMSSPWLLFQMASGPKHSISLGLLKVLDDLQLTNKAQDSVKKACALGMKPLHHPLYIFCTTPDNFENSYKKLQPFGEGKKRKPDIVRQAVLNIPIDIVEEHLGGEVHFKRSIKPPIKRSR